MTDRPQYAIRDTEGRLYGRRSVSGPLEPVPDALAYLFDSREDAQQAAGTISEAVEVVER